MKRKFFLYLNLICISYYKSVWFKSLFLFLSSYITPDFLIGVIGSLIDCLEKLDYHVNATRVLYKGNVIVM